MGNVAEGGHWQESPNTTGKRCFPASFLHLPTAVAPVAVGLQGPAPGELQEHC